MNYNTLVKIRTQMVEDLHNAIRLSEKDNKKYHITKILNKINRTNGYKVDLNCLEDFYSLGRHVMIKHIKIIEGRGDFSIRLFVNEFGRICLKYDHHMLKTFEEMRDEQMAEIEAEQEMNAWALGYRTSNMF